MERYVIIVNGWKPLTIITKRSILDVAAVLDPPLTITKQIRNSCHNLTRRIMKLDIFKNVVAGFQGDCSHQTW